MTGAARRALASWPQRSNQHDCASIGELLEFATAFPSSLSEYKILRFLINAVIRTPKLTAAVALFVLAALASTITYTGFLLVGVLADYLGTGRVAAGLLLAALFARFPWIRHGKLRIVGLLAKPVRRPVIVGLLALGLMHFLSRSEFVPAGFMGFTTAFVVFFPWLRRAMFDRVQSSFFKFTGRKPAQSSDDTVIEGEFRERKD